MEVFCWLNKTTKPKTNMNGDKKQPNKTTVELLLHSTSGYHIAENFCQFCHLLSLVKTFSANFLFCVHGYIEDIVTLAKIYSSKYFCNTKVTGLGEI